MDHPVALALSGGGDSLALLDIAATWATGAGRRLFAVTVDHGLDPDSAAWSALCERAARAAGADWTLRRWSGDKPATGLPAAARRARHALIAEAAREAAARVVLFAHTADDVAEGDWMRARGATLGRVREWSPSPAWPEGRGLMLLRPLLGEGREPLRALLRAAGREWIEDPGNARHGRGRARAALAALRVAGDATPAGEGMDGAVREDRRPAPLPLGAGFAIDRLIDPRTLAVVLACASGRSDRPRAARLARLSARLAEGAGFAVTLAGARVVAKDETVLVGREPGELRRRPVPDHVLTPGRPAVWDGRYEITANEPGWTVTAALGRLNALSAEDRIVAASAPPWARPALPVLIRDGASAPVLAWRHAEVRALAPRRLLLARWTTSGETTQESDLARTIHGETPPPDLF